MWFAGLALWNQIQKLAEIPAAEFVEEGPLLFWLDVQQDLSVSLAPVVFSPLDLVIKK